jgi:outer membrane protein OmpA-like peptidoglycan-associated protein
VKHILLLLLLLGLVPWCWSQDEEVESNANPDQEGCKDSKTINRIPGCVIFGCELHDFNAVELVTGDDDKTTTVEGGQEQLNYKCPEKVSPLQMVRNVQNALTATGFAAVFNGKNTYGDYVFTARKGGQWISAQAGASPGGAGNGYVLTTVVTREMEQYLKASAIEAEIGKNGRIAIYGINFDTGKATIRPESAKVLGEIVTALKDHPEWKLTVEGHTDNQGASPLNQRLSELRAASVVEWLVQNGIAKARFTAVGFGDSRPVADNTAEDGRARNRRVELVKQ